MCNSNPIDQILLKFTDSFKQHRENISTVLLSPEKHLWLGSDETVTIERLTLIDSETFAEHKQYNVTDFIPLPVSTENEIDIEGLTYADNYLWFVGSHSYKRKKPKSDKSDTKNIQRLATTESEANRYLLGRIPLVGGELFASCLHPQDSTQQLSAAKLEVTFDGNSLVNALANDPHLGVFISAKIPGKDNGFDIEGIEVAQNRVLLGLRGPVLRGWAMMLEIELESISPGLLKLVNIGEMGKLYKKHFVFLNGLGIRDLCCDGQDLLILAGPTMDLDGPVQIYRLKNGLNLPEGVLNYPEVLSNIPYGNRDDHAEGITLFNDVSKKPSVLVVYDSPSITKRLVGDGGVLADLFELLPTL